MREQEIMKKIKVLEELVNELDDKREEFYNKYEQLGEHIEIAEQKIVALKAMLKSEKAENKAKIYLHYLKEMIDKGIAKNTASYSEDQKSIHFFLQRSYLLVKRYAEKQGKEIGDLKQICRNFPKMNIERAYRKTAHGDRENYYIVPLFQSLL